jgi:enhancer of polycomb-like protein
LWHTHPHPTTTTNADHAQEHHLQAALSSASLLHSRDASKPESPASRDSVKPEAPSASNAALNYHIPTPDATGLIDNVNYAKLYQTHKFNEPTNYIRFSDTVEESACGAGGLSYCMDDTDMAWLASFNGKAEGGSGDSGAPTSPTNGRTERRAAKGKEKEKDVPASLNISEDVFEYIMGVLEKHAEDAVPTLHTNLALMPTFQSTESLFSSPLAATFYPSNEVPKDLPEPRLLTRMARSIFPHWKSRREQRGGKSIMPQLNYDETNDNDPYVCFRRRDVRAARKTRRTDNHSVEQFQKLQFELRKAHDLATLVLRREREKQSLYAAEKEVWEAKWKLFETKRRWPSLGVTRDEEEIITGRQNGAAAAAAAVAAINGQMGLTHLGGGQSANSSRSHSRKQVEKDREERDRRERAIEAARQAERSNLPGKSMAPEAVRERLLAQQTKLEEELARRKALDSHWDDYTDTSYQPLPSTHAAHAFRNVAVLDPRHRSDSDTDEDERVIHPMAFRMRRGRGGRVLLDRRLPVRAARRGAMPTSPDRLRDWYFPDMVDGRVSRRRPRSIDADDEDTQDDDLKPGSRKRQRLNEIMRYDSSQGGAVGVGMGLTGDDDRLVLDDYDIKYMRYRVGLLMAEDIRKLYPDATALKEAIADLSAPVELPRPPKFIKPAPANPQMMAYSQLMQQQHQIEQIQRINMMAQAQQQQQLEQARLQQQQQQQQQQAALAAQAQAQAQAHAQAQAVQAVQATANAAANGVSTPGSAVPNGVANGVPNGRPQPKRSPTDVQGSPAQSVQTPGAAPSTPQQVQTPQQQQLAAALAANGGQLSPQIMNGAANGKPFAVGPGGIPGVPTPAGAVDPQLHQQRLTAARAAMLQQAQQQQNELENATPEQRRELAQLAQQNGFGGNVQGFIEARNRARLISFQKLAQAQATIHAQTQGAQHIQMQQGQIPVPMQPINVGNVVQPNGFPSPGAMASQLQLKLPPHAQARLAGTTPPTPQAQAQRS